jgi:hypothetical protein
MRREECDANFDAQAKEKVVQRHVEHGISLKAQQTP